MLPGSDRNQVHLGVYQAMDRNQEQLKGTNFGIQNNRAAFCASASWYTPLPCYPWLMSHRGAPQCWVQFRTRCLSGEGSQRISMKGSQNIWSKVIGLHLVPVRAGNRFYLISVVCTCTCTAMHCNASQAWVRAKLSSNIRGASPIPQPSFLHFYQ
jgi:hypothetical protein